MSKVFNQTHDLPEILIAQRFFINVLDLHLLAHQFNPSVHPPWLGHQNYLRKFQLHAFGFLNFVKNVLQVLYDFAPGLSRHLLAYN
jgi:hypothetical protein